MTRARLALLLLTACGGGAGSDAGPGGDGGGSVDAAVGPIASIHLLGRFDGGPGDAAGARFAWPGSTIVARFDGDAIAINLEETGSNQYEVTLDGAAQPVLITAAGTQDYPLASGLAAGEHQVRVARRTESSFGVTAFHGFSGATLVDSEGPTRWIEMIGDSITCGYGVLGDGPTCSFSADTEAESHAWGALAAADLGAAHTAIAYSGIGVYQNFGGEPGPTMPDRFALTFADDPSSAWPFAAYTPQVVAINLGTNDFSNGDPGSAFVDAYTDFVAQVRGHYPDADIVIALSPMLSDGFPVGAMHRTLAAGYLQDVVAGAGSRVSYLALDEQLDSDGLGCDYHPGQVTQQKMAAALVEHVRGLTGW
ncbi:MAG TPA: SGNH/GDSL hydrolase family protein [Kofleriaceae bacterium]|jgi:lysophospholipase L1-like esterase|nr:SGNH/GDSL hydrolase family protein [Kofleriaceae bacterium]